MNTFKPEIQELLKAVEKKYSQNLRTTTDFDVFSLHLKASTRCIHIHFDPKAVVGLCQRQAQTEESDT